MDILIVENDTSFAEFVKKSIQAWGYRAEQSGSGKAALRRVQEKNFDLLLLDIGLPDYRGYELIPRLRKIQPGIGVITMTDHNYKNLELRTREQNIFFYMIKPFQTEELRVLLNHISQKYQKQCAALC
jgi:DNA-binding response OmpR family regulator